MITILGATGFVGAALVKKLSAGNVSLNVPERNSGLTGTPLGHVIYCIGLTADFRSRPFDTMEAHVGKLGHLLQHGAFESLTYLSSTRVYSNCTAAEVSETSLVSVNVQDPADLFNTSKLAGETLAMHCGREHVKVVRLSNVYGPDYRSDNFITAIIKEAVHTSRVVLRTTMDSSKDYIHIDDVVNVLEAIALRGQQKIYNLASGQNVSNGAVLQRLQEITGCVLEVSPHAAQIIFPGIDTSRIREEFGFEPTATLLEQLPAIVEGYKNYAATT
jgi:nucleoside-diphosphate-sugar epimerase